MSSGAGAGGTFLGTGAGVTKSDSDHLCTAVQCLIRVFRIQTSSDQESGQYYRIRIGLD